MAYTPELRLKGGATLILEVKGYDPLTEIKQAGARRWISAVNNERSFGLWDFAIIYQPGDLNIAVFTNRQRRWQRCGVRNSVNDQKQVVAIQKI